MYASAAELSGSADGQPVEARLNAALSDGSCEIDSYLGARFVTPIDPIPPVLTRLACDIAAYRLFEAARDEDIKDVRRRYEDAIAWLKDSVAGAAPIHHCRTASLNEIEIVNSDERGRALFGPDLEGYSVPMAVTINALEGGPLMLAINVFDPSIHYSVVDPAPIALRFIRMARIIGWIAQPACSSGWQAARSTRLRR